MANSLISQEAALYDSAGVPHGHVWRLVIVSEVEYDGARVATFVLRSLDGRPLPGFQPGQYISLCVRLPDGTRQIRQYTLVRGGRVPRRVGRHDQAGPGRSGLPRSWSTPSGPAPN